MNGVQNSEMHPEVSEINLQVHDQQASKQGANGGKASSHRKGARLSLPAEKGETRLNSQQHNQAIRNKWYQNYAVPESYVDLNAIEVVSEPVEPDLSAFESLWAMEKGVDTRPHIYDRKMKQYLLLDSGAQISACPPDPEDKPDHNMSLRAANGSKMKCFGTKKLTVQINRKEYSIQAIKTEVKSPILGWNFVRKHRLGFEWNDWGDVCLVDKKSGISAPLTFKKLPVEQSGLAAINLKTPDSSEQVEFELACLKSLTPEENDISENIENDISKLPDSEYKSLLERFPDLLKLHFEEEFTKNGIQHRILTGDAKPTKAKKRNMLPGSPREIAAKAAFKKLVELGIVEPVSPGDPNNWVSPIHFVPKPGGGLRPVGDYRDLNSKTQLDQYPLPNVRGFTQEIRGATVFSKVDLCKAFHQIMIDKRDRWKTCVATPWGLYNFKRLSMGLKNSGQSFQRLIESVLSGLPETFVYLDDILIFSKSKHQHLKTLEELFKRLSKAGLTISLSKCEFGKEQLDYLGYTVSSKGVKPIEKKTEAIQNYPVPEKPKQLLAFLGALNYYRASLPNLPPDKNFGYARTPAEILAPLYHVATADIKPTEFKKVWNGNPNLLVAFNEAKLLLRRAATLNYPDPTAPIALSTDASKFALGASLDQFVDGVWRPLGFWSKALKPTQQNYSTYRRELMAIMYSMRYFNDMFNGRDLTVFCDHRPIIGTFKSQELQSHDPIALNAIREIGMFTSDIRHKEGKALIVPDWLSRPAGCPVGRAYEVETTNDFENDKFQFKLPDIKGKIKRETIKSSITSAPSGDSVKTVAPSIEAFAKATPSGKNRQTAAPPGSSNCQYADSYRNPTHETSSGELKMPKEPSGERTENKNLTNESAPKYVPPHLTIAALEQVALQMLSPEVIKAEQERCPDVEAHKRGNMPKNVVTADVEIMGNVLYCEVSNPQNPRPLLPSNLRSTVVNLLHHSDHPNYKETTRRVATDYYWPGLRKDIKNFVLTCHPCQLAKQSKTVNPGVGHFEVPDTRFSVLHLDIVGPLPKSHDGYKYMLTCFDRTSRWFEAYPLKEDTASEVASAFMQWVSRFGVCDRAVSDNGNAFIARLFQDIMKTFSIEVTFTPAYHAATNGAIERQHQTMKNALKAALIDMGDVHREQWTRALPWVLLGKRVQYQPFLDSSSAQLVLGKSPKLPGQLLRDPGPPLNTVETRALLDQLYKLQDRPGIPTSAKTVEYDISHTLKATHAYIKVSKPGALCSKFEGPYRIHDRPSRSTITVDLGKKKDGSLRLQTYHWSSAKIAHMRDGAEVAQRPKLGRPPKPIPEPSSSESELVNKNSSEDKNKSKAVNATVTTGQCQQSLSPSQPISAPVRTRGRPIKSASASETKSGKIQNKNRVLDPESGRQVHPAYLQKGPLITKQMLDNWSPDISNASSNFTNTMRPVRSTRNNNPVYIDAFANQSR